MIRICVCCAGGFSSSFIAKAINTQMMEAGKENEVSVSFMSFFTAGKNLEKFDVIFCCPHLRVHMDNFLKDYKPQIPIYVMPKRMYGLMTFDSIYEEAQDVIELYKINKTNPVIFPNEENYNDIKRFESFRHVYGDFHQYTK